MQGIQCCTVQLNIILYYSQRNTIQNDAMQYNTVHEDHALTYLSQYTVYTYTVPSHVAGCATPVLSDCVLQVVRHLYSDYDLQAIRHLYCGYMLHVVRHL